MKPVEPTFSPHSGAVHALVDDLRAAGHELDAFVDRQLDSLATMLGTLDERQGQFDSRREALDEQAAQLERRERSLAALRQLAEQGAWRVQQEAERLARSRLEHAAASSQAGARPNESDSSDSARLRAALHEAEARLASMAGLASDLNDARRDIVRLQSRLMKQANRLAEAKGHFANAASDRIRLLESERATLAMELELARNELQQHAERTESSRRTRAQERGVWLGEIKRMRQALERSAMTGPAREGPAPFLESDDASLDEIVARLETLQNAFDEPAGGQQPFEAELPIRSTLDSVERQPAHLTEETTRCE